MSNPLWASATEHEFVHGVRDGSLPTAAFDRWLMQDYLFVGDLLWFQARLLARAPRPAQSVLASGCVAIVDELAWFTERAAERGLDLGQDRLPGTQRYRELLEQLDTASFNAAATALWAVEQVYLDAWTLAGSAGRPEYQLFYRHWTTPDFADYVADLRVLAAPDAEQDTVSRVLEHEIGFWDTALGS